MTLTSEFAKIVEAEIQKHNKLTKRQRRRRPTILEELKLAHSWLASCGIKVTPVRE